MKELDAPEPYLHLCLYPYLYPYLQELEAPEPDPNAAGLSFSMAGVWEMQGRYSGDIGVS